MSAWFPGSKNPFAGEIGNAMLKRLAVVIWWLGSIVWAGTAFGCLYKQASQLYEQHQCAAIFAEYASWQHKYDNAKARYEVDHKNKPTKTPAHGSTSDDTIPLSSLRVPGKTPEPAKSDPIDMAFPEPKTNNATVGKTDSGDRLDELLALDDAVPMRTGLKETVDRCGATVDKTYWFALLGATVFTLLAFSSAFVFGGQFWLPPKIPEQLID
jgi:hypothetical protein